MASQVLPKHFSGIPSERGVCLFSELPPVDNINGDRIVVSDKNYATYVWSNGAWRNPDYNDAGNALAGPDGNIRLKQVTGSGWNHVFNNAPSAATPFTFANQSPCIPKFVGVQFGFINTGTASYTVSGCKVAAAPIDAHNGQSLTWSDVTFDGGVSSGTAPKVIPAGSGATVDAVPGGFVASDVIPLTPLDRTDIVGSPYLVQTRTYLSSNSSLQQAQAGGIAAFRAATGLEYGSTFLAGDQVANPATSPMAPVSSGTWICPALVKFFYEAPTINVAGPGDSLMRGQGSTSGHNSGEEIACRQLSSASKVYAYANYGISGQHLAASFATAQAILASPAFRPHVLVWKAFSPNDAYTQVNFDAAYLYLLRLMELCQQNGVALVVRNAQRWNQTVGVTAQIEAFNARLAKLTGLYLNDDYAILAAGSSDPTKNNPAYSVSAGDPHDNDAGYAALSSGGGVAPGLKNLIKLAYPA